MIHVSQGHQNGIGLEIYLKALLCLPQEKIDKFILYAFKEDLTLTLHSFLKDYKYTENSLLIFGKNIYIHFLKKIDLPHSTASLYKALRETEKDDSGILLTLPTSKDMIVDPQRPSLHFLGHTEFFRHYYANQNISMVFHRDDTNMLLITDHLSLENFLKTINEKIIFEKIKITLTSFPKNLKIFKRVLIAGINPHAGEGGLLGTEEKLIINAINKLKNEFSETEFLGPYPSDTMYLNRKSHDLLVYLYHDQGLPLFKGVNKFYGINISVGMPRLRVSVDHGTAFDKFLKNSSCYSGLLYLMEKIL